MKLSLLLIAVPAAQAAVSYMSAVPDKLMAMVEASEDCNLPDDFQIQNFTAESADGKTADSLDFTFNDDSTVLNTQCHLNASSVPVSGDGRTPRFALVTTVPPTTRLPGRPRFRWCATEVPRTGRAMPPGHTGVQGGQPLHASPTRTTSDRDSSASSRLVERAEESSHGMNVKKQTKRDAMTVFMDDETYMSEHTLRGSWVTVTDGRP
ncbi:uncharacterized protein CLUP02_05982 [Colletotrichum lupini]|uniref:Uncharacterized protein n=1 Tax=Colletotrichum lupini TaxID=145971 RepID=A0A9Q8WEL6_9PEZI|nr:uncharacterized protein CLUP02_05982 [Colletotrichum lupini]UQC80499.1 hypothetical protein CLUP02_05982 [Colletotrichum lupini]